MGESSPCLILNSCRFLPLDGSRLSGKGRASGIRPSICGSSATLSRWNPRQNGNANQNPLRLMSITATVENNTIKLPIDVPDGTSVEVDVPDLEPELSPAEKVALLKKLQQSLALTPEAVAEWRRVVKEGRR